MAGHSKTVKLRTHPIAPPNDSEFIFNSKDFPSLRIGDVVEIYEKDTTSTRLLLPVSRIHDEFTQRETVSVELSVAVNFKLTQYRNVSVTKVDPQSVALDLVELCFKEQYISRSDMWRLKKFLINPPKYVVYMNKKIEFCGMRSQVNEMWSKGERVACGVVLPNTRVVFRSASSAIHIFIQMSQEMWEFDYQGDLYFEKCVNGFFPDLFQLWKEKNCAHYVNIVVFSRWYYDASSRQNFPPKIAEKILQDNHGRFYQDFYRLIVQNEHYEDWSPVLAKLKGLLNEYKQSIGRYHSLGFPPARNSSAQEGNYLEVINISLNIFAKHYLDRTFERTGQVTVIVTPGQGVFKVDRNLCNLTKQRVNDVGLAVDLVCLGEQPLHAVPLFIFPSKRASASSNDHPDLREDFIIPHWMNFSFYNPVKYARSSSSSFIPRIKIPESVMRRIQNEICLPILDSPIPNQTPNRPSAIANLRSPVPSNVGIDYELYDDAIFSSATSAKKKAPGIEKQKFEFTELPELTPEKRSPSESSLDASPPPVPISKNLFGSAAWNIPGRKVPDDFDHSSLVAPSLGDQPAGSLEPEGIAAETPPKAPNDLRNGTGIGAAGGAQQQKSAVWKVGSADDCTASSAYRTHSALLMRRKRDRQMQKARKPLMNPFKPAEFSVRITSNRRRFIHCFPVDSAGRAKQAHHFVSGMPVIYLTPDKESSADPSELPYNFSSENLEILPKGVAADGGYRTPLSPVNPSASTVGCEAQGKTLVWAWGVTGEEQWNPDLKISVDWKSLTVPACLPITIDFFPDNRSLRNDYHFAAHQLILDESLRDLWARDKQKRDFSLEIFDELVSQRLHQAFQMIVLPAELLHSATAGLLGQDRLAFEKDRLQAECYLCIDRIFHRLALIANTLDGVNADSTIYVTKFLPRHPYPLEPFAYVYQLQVPDSLDYAPAESRFVHDALELYKWSQLDNYIAWKGQSDEYALERDSKFWEARFLLLPSVHPSVRKLTENVHQNFDIFTSDVDAMSSINLIDGFVKILESLNRIRRTGNVYRVRKPTPSTESKEIFPPEPQPVPGTGPELTKAMPSAILNFLRAGGRGFSFLPKDTRFPDYTFLSVELVHWLLENVGDLATVKEAVDFCQSLVDDGRIRRVAQNRKRQFEYGFCLYYLVAGQQTMPIGLPSKELPQSPEWFEVRISDEPVCCTDGEHTHCEIRTVGIDIDASSKSDRHEWGFCRYGSAFSPRAAFELSLQWLVATGCLVSELVSNWFRKAASSSFHLIPAPMDPFSLTVAFDFDPLRRPIFVRLELPEQLIQGMEQEHATKIRSTQIRILERFGFVTMSCSKHARTDGERQFVHLTGGIFAMTVFERTRIGFLWSWNHMLGKRYRSPATGDDAFQDAILADFRRFCANDARRLEAIFTE